MSDDLRSYRVLAAQVAAQLRVPGLRSVYLVGSLARGNFVPGLSDIDLVAFTDASQTSCVELWAHRPAGPRSAWQLVNPARALGCDPTLISVCVRPLTHAYDPLEPIRWAGRPARRSVKELTAISDLMFLWDHGQHLFGADVRSLCLLPARPDYRAYLRWEARTASRGRLRPGIADNPRRAAKRIATLIRDLLFLCERRVSSSPAELLAFASAHLDPSAVVTVASALWLSSVPLHADPPSRLALRAIELVMQERARVFEQCRELDRRVNPGQPAVPLAWPQIADLDTESFELRGPTSDFSDVVPVPARRISY